MRVKVCVLLVIGVDEGEGVATIAVHETIALRRPHAIAIDH